MHLSAMSIPDDGDEFGDLADEDLIEALSQASQTLPPLPTKRRNEDSAYNSDGDGGEQASEHDGPRPKKKYKVHIGYAAVPEARVVGATQAEAMPDSSPYRIRGPIYKKSRPPPPAPSPRLNISDVHKNGPLDLIFKAPKKRTNAVPTRDDLVKELENLPPEAFSDDEYGPIAIGSSLERSFGQSSAPRQRLVAPQTSLRQTTLFGGRATQEVTTSQAKKVYNYIVDQPPEAPTHHALDNEALKTWVYPTNLGVIRDYQYSIVHNGLFNNLLVALPTGLGKTFIAATIMLNYFRWTKDAKIVFVAPTKPLVAQQVSACFNIVGIPRSTTTMLTGEQAPGLRAEEWVEKRVFFMTPQTLENDLRSGIADPKKIVLLVVDEAHRATGNYSYVKVVSFLRRFSDSFRILALTATPGSSVEAVQEVIDSLEIAKVDIRTEESIDIRQFVHRRNIDEIVLDPFDEMIMIKGLLAKALQPLVNQLCGQNAYYNKDPMALTTYGLMQAQSQWYKSDAGRKASQGLKNMMRALFSILAGVAHSIKLLNFHGIGPFYSHIKDFRQGVEDGNKGGKYRTQIINSPDFKKMMDRVQHWLNKDDFVGHPKLTYLCDTILNHFLDAGEGRLPDGAPPSNTRVIVFAEYRDSAEDIARVLNRHRPMVRASVFVGQADSARSAGMNQAKQLETINNFKTGVFNVIVATSIGEEGLDIGQVDLIVCYDSSNSPIRMLQRMGRTGRKRAGNIVCLLMRGKEEESFTKSKHNYEKMQEMISSGDRFKFRHDLSRRIIPKEVKPVVDKRMIGIPAENTQDSSMPEPKKRVRTKKLPPKKFHMPDGVETGFRKASKLSNGGGQMTGFSVSREASHVDVVVIPSLEDVLLTSDQERELLQRYQKTGAREFEAEVSMPDLTCQTTTQRTLTPTVHVAHGSLTTRCVKLFQALGTSQNIEDRYTKPYGDVEPSDEDWKNSNAVQDDNPVKTPRSRKAKKAPAAKRQSAIQQRTFTVADESCEECSHEETPKAGRNNIQMPSSEGPAETVDGSSQGASEDDVDEVGTLEDFLADEDDIDGDIDGATTGATSSFSSVTPRRTATKSTPRSHAQSIEIIQDGNDTVTDIDEAGKAKKASKIPSSDTEEITRPAKRLRQRRFVEEDDSDG